MNMDQGKSLPPLSLAQLVELFSEQLKCSKARAAFVLRNLFRNISQHLAYAKNGAMLSVSICWVGGIVSPELRNEFYRIDVDDLVDYFTNWAKGDGRERIQVVAMLGDNSIESDAAIFFAPDALIQLAEEAGTKWPLSVSTLAATEELGCQAVSAASLSLSREQCAVMAARLVFIHEIGRLNQTLSQQQSIMHLVGQANAGRLSSKLTEQLSCANDRAGEDRTLSERTLKRWLSAYRRHGLTGLAPVRRGPRLSMPSWGSAFLEHYWKLERPTVKAAYASFASSSSGECPSVHQVRNFMSKLKIRL